MIFCNSYENGKVQQSKSQSVWDAYQEITGVIQILPRLSHHQIRKIAHFVEYAVEGFMIMIWFNIVISKQLRYLGYPILFCLVTALADETFQLVVQGRSGQLTDVWIDTAGAVFGIAIAVITTITIGRKAINRENQKNS